MCIGRMVSHAEVMGAMKGKTCSEALFILGDHVKTALAGDRAQIPVSWISSL